MSSLLPRVAEHAAGNDRVDEHDAQQDTSSDLPDALAGVVIRRIVFKSRTLFLGLELDEISRTLMAQAALCELLVKSDEDLGAQLDVRCGDRLIALVRHGRPAERNRQGVRVVPCLSVVLVQSRFVSLDVNALRLRWIELAEAHATCLATLQGRAGAADALRPVCRSWLRGLCTEGSHFRKHCTLRHRFTSQAEQDDFERRAQASARRSERDVRENEADEAHGPAERRSRGESDWVFAAWLVQTFGLARLAGGSGVLDIAGGRGELSFHLQCMHGIPATVMDPRPEAVLCKAHRKRISALARERNCSPQAVKFRHIRTEFTADLATSAEPELSDLVNRAAMVVAMHPDEATEPALVTALALRKPFAIVPCCLFARQNPHRVHLDGGPVNTYARLLDYLQAKNPGIQRTRLPFDGRNVVLWHSGEYD